MTRLEEGIMELKKRLRNEIFPSDVKQLLETQLLSMEYENSLKNK